MQPYTYAMCVCCAQSNSYSDEDVARIVKYFLVDAHTDQFLKKKRDGRRRRNLLNLAEWSKEDLAGRGIREIWDFLFGEMKSHLWCPLSQPFPSPAVLIPLHV